MTDHRPGDALEPKTVSVIIPAHNAARFIVDAIDSVLAQSVPVELVVVNDGSTDDTPAVIAGYGDRLVRVDQDQRGLGAARNRGIGASRADLIAFLDADDIWLPDKLARQLQLLADRPHADMVFGHCVEFADARGGERLFAREQPMPAYVAGAMLARRALFERVGGFSEDRAVGEFIDWYSRACDAGAASVMLDALVFRRRVHATNMTRLATNRSEQYINVIRAHLQRSRGAG